MAKRKYDYFHVANLFKAENFGDYHEAMRFYGKSEKPSTLYGVIGYDGNGGDDYICIKSK